MWGYISEGKLPSKWVWLHLQTSAAHRACYYSLSVELSSQAALTALLLPASQTDVPETHAFTVHSPMQSVCQPTSDHGGKECCTVRTTLATVLQEMIGLSFLLILSPSPIQASRHNRARKGDANSHVVGADRGVTFLAGVNQDYEKIMFLQMGCISSLNSRVYTHETYKTINLTHPLGSSRSRTFSL